MKLLQLLISGKLWNGKSQITVMFVVMKNRPRFDVELTSKNLLCMIGLLSKLSGILFYHLVKLLFLCLVCHCVLVFLQWSMVFDYILSYLYGCQLWNKMQVNNTKIHESLLLLSYFVIEYFYPLMDNSTNTHCKYVHRNYNASDRPHFNKEMYQGIKCEWCYKLINT